MEPLVSILIPAYNSEAWIAATLESALAQTWKRKEIIVVDDGSRDQTLAVARRFASRGVFVETQLNQGAAAARNKALSLSQGDYIQWLDADDLLSRDKVEKQISAVRQADNGRVLLSGEWAYFMHRPKKARFVATPLWCDLSPVDWLVRKLDFNLHMQTATWLVSRELTGVVGSWNTQLLGDDDGEYFCRVLLASDGVRFTPGARVYYRRNPRSLSHIGTSNRKIEAQFASMRLHIDYLRSLEDSERVRTACLKYLQRYLIYFYPERPDIVEQAYQLAETLGGRLQTPELPWKYAWIQKTFGWRLGKRAWVELPQIRERAVRCWDRALSRLQRETLICS